eukprot:c14709_g1_i1.p1 GENE.c14709_g1_i1~~c14709_g1_i1.p1  ORF type:complete len:177 (-),score=32.92 c14709_g1_i1:22-552(-)
MISQPAEFVILRNERALLHQINTSLRRIDDELLESPGTRQQHQRSFQLPIPFHAKSLVVQVRVFVMNRGHPKPDSQIYLPTVENLNEWRECGEIREVIASDQHNPVVGHVTNGRFGLYCGKGIGMACIAFTALFESVDQVNWVPKPNGRVLLVNANPHVTVGTVQQQLFPVLVQIV